MDWKFIPIKSLPIEDYTMDINKLYTSVLVYDSDSIKLTGLNKHVMYYFNIDLSTIQESLKGQRR